MVDRCQRSLRLDGMRGSARRICGLIAGLIWVLLLHAAHPCWTRAVEVAWDSGAGGSYLSANNWQPQRVPLPFEDAVFNLPLPGTYSVGFTSSPTVARMLIGGDGVTFLLNGQTYTVTSDTEIGYAASRLAGLTLRDGDVAGNRLLIGSAAGATGQLLVTDAARWSGSESVIGKGGLGTLKIEHGNIVSASTMIGDAATAIGRATVTGGDSQWLASSNLVVGNLGDGSLEVIDGGTLTSGAAQLGVAAGSTGIADVRGAGARWDAASLIAVGVAGHGQLSVADGGQLTSATAFIARAAGSRGDATLTGSGSQWTTTGALVVGGDEAAAGGTATLNVLDDAVLDVGTSPNDVLKIHAGGTLTLDGGVVNTRRFEQAGTFNFVDGTLNIAGGAFLPLGETLTLSGAAGSRPTLRLQNGASASGLTTVVVGGTGTGALELLESATLSSNDGFVGRNVGADGQVTVGGGNTRWDLGGSLSIGGDAATAGGVGVLNIEHGAAVNAASGTVRVWPGGVVNLNGGTLRMARYEPRGGRFNFQGGTLALVGPTMADDALVTALLGPAHALGTGKTWSAGNMTLRGALQLVGGAMLVDELENEADLVVAGGMLASPTLANRAGGFIRVAEGGVIDAANILHNSGEVELAGSTTLLRGGQLINEGLLAGRGRIAMSLENAVSGEVRAGNGDRLMFLGGANANRGRLEAADGGALEFSQSLANEANGLIAGHDGDLRFAGGLINQGSMAFATGLMDVFGDIQNAAGGRITISGRGAATFYDDLVNEGIVQVSAGSTAVYFGSLTGSGSFTGTGAVFIEGDLRPGSSPAEAFFGGDLLLASSAVTVLELAGTQVGSGHDQLDVGGLLSLSGALEVTLLDGFVPRLGDSFDLLDFGSLAGRFERVDLPALDGGLAWDASGLYSEGTIAVVPEPRTMVLALVSAIALVLRKRWRETMVRCLRGPHQRIR